MDAQREALLIFRGAYGRLCVLSAIALNDGYHRDAVLLASRGKGTSRDRNLKALRRARAIVNLALKNARDHGNEGGAIVEIGRQAKDAVETEWECRIPLVSSVR